MHKDYLWDGSGEPDPEVRRLEELLSRYTQKPNDTLRPFDGDSDAAVTDKVAETDTGTDAGEETPTPAREEALDQAGKAAQDQAREAANDRARFDAASRTGIQTAAASRRRRRIATIVALPFAAVFLFATIAIWRSARQTSSGWEVVRLEGTPALGTAPVTEKGRMAVGGWLETDAVSRATIKVGMIGEAELEPSTRVQLVSASLTEHRLALARGTLHARIWAPPRLFYVETPSALAVDLGCRYTLTVDDAGASLLKVESGWVAFEHEGRESFVPAGALCVTRPGTGPGTPYFEDASPQFREALTHLDFASQGSDEQGARQPTRVEPLGRGVPGETGSREKDPATCVDRAGSIGVILDEARGRDSLTLWHLLSRLEGEERGRVYDRMAALVPPPAGVTRDAVLRGDSEMIDRWWDQLGLGVTSWWRVWKSPGPPQAR